MRCATCQRPRLTCNADLVAEAGATIFGVPLKVVMVIRSTLRIAAIDADFCAKRLYLYSA